MRLGFGNSRAGLRSKKSIALSKDKRMGRRKIIGERIDSACHEAMESQRVVLASRAEQTSHNAALYPATCGLNVCCGERQSIPSRR